MIQITRPNPTDIHLIFEIYQQCMIDLEKQNIHQWNDHYPNQGNIEEDLRNNSIYIAKYNQEIVGVVSFDDQDFQEYQTVDWKDKEGRFAVIHRLAVKPTYQGLGIAKTLMQFAYDRCSEQKYGSIRLDVFGANEKAVLFYHKLGFETRGEVYFDGRTSLFYCMEKEIASPK
ncbi:GNAT family N-acetyltransferase [Cohnella endophytica]|uniref:GNAT family N-acetyltransferase n=1 Tax=Cohnella endophytica TaxID=2419778 RepID=A0A494XY70_9BACL|nr:GNAT family N-acetyltransferase [Cohnella endophytica]RKP55545.1 GNAT family N-acetyltransferase [Cohnella endophytica]